jgi:hypothetical protein
LGYARSPSSVGILEGSSSSIGDYLFLHCHNRTLWHRFRSVTRNVERDLARELALVDLSKRSAVRKAIDEFDLLGREAFLGRYGFEWRTNIFWASMVSFTIRKPSSAPRTVSNFQGTGPLKWNDFTVGKLTVRRKLQNCVQPCPLPQCLKPH